jgi:hypothetical protein
VNEWIDEAGDRQGRLGRRAAAGDGEVGDGHGRREKAQDLLTLAMDVSAGSGKSLDQVTSALVKAQNGSVGGLARMGLATKTTAKDTAALKTAQVGVKSAQLAYTSAVKAHGKTSAEASIASDKLKIAQQKLKDAHDKTKSSTISSADAIDLLTKKYKGDAAKAADTTAGKQRVLGVEFHELSVKIGTAVIPAFQKLVEIGLKVVDFISKHTKGVGLAVAAFGGLLTVTWAVGTAMGVYAAVTGEATAATLLQKAAVGAWAVVTKAAAAAQWLFNAAMDANPDRGRGHRDRGVGAGLILAYKHSETFRNIVNAPFKAVSVASACGRVHQGPLAAPCGDPARPVRYRDRADHQALGGDQGRRAGGDRLGAGCLARPQVHDRRAVPVREANHRRRLADIKTGFGVVRDVLGDDVNRIKSAFSTAFGVVKSVIQTVIDKVQWLLDKLGDLYNKLTHIPQPPHPGAGAHLGRRGELAGAIAGGTKEQIAPSTRRWTSCVRLRRSTWRS